MVSLYVISHNTRLLEGCKVLVQYLVFGRAAAFGPIFEGSASESLAVHASTLLSIKCKVYFNFMAAVTICSDFGAPKQYKSHKYGIRESLINSFIEM